jgi:hypothetical protein
MECKIAWINRLALEQPTKLTCVIQSESSRLHDHRQEGDTWQIRVDLIRLPLLCLPYTNKGIVKIYIFNRIHGDIKYICNLNGSYLST